MEFFGLTHYGPQNYVKDLTKNHYQEPTNKEDVIQIIKKVKSESTCSLKVQRPDVNVIRIIDCYIGRVNGFAYGSMQRFVSMKHKGVIKPVGPADIYRLPPTTSTEYGWWLYDPDLANKKWFVTCPRYPQPSSPNNLILDKERKNNKYATLF